MKRSADGKKKWALLTEKPAAASGIPNEDELNAGIDFSCVVLESDISWSPTASDTFNEKTSCQVGNSSAFGASNYDTALTFIREYLEAGGPDSIAGDKAYEAVRVKGSEVGIYMRESDKFSTEPWEAGDIIDLGGKVRSDNPARVNNDGDIKRRVPFAAQDMIVEKAVLAGTP
ncbi:hypothetical protein FQP90_13615 [Paenarthrobacter nitroguajacolicus]|uniref:Uncharacterized protein n=1 Tax=Paenarthrobacter nitroguajacolicus TaxID=211146 RepID=A0A558GXG4_PAENT|nr:hypothetical protein [Paenarthrobacter nitroguajacolicus]TVU61573.1 hypothetical protein FQP90_13615 [Paenarthrobacter nitroguajacolicus]